MEAICVDSGKRSCWPAHGSTTENGCRNMGKFGLLASWFLIDPPANEKFKKLKHTLGEYSAWWTAECIFSTSRPLCYNGSKSALENKHEQNH
jgi:hypothetical protein